jgi:two-component system, chemotaxis family, protein-glutamate methylesterase/glutaminase
VNYRHLSYEAVVIGVSAGGLFALSGILGELPVDFPLPIVVIQHRSKDERILLEDVLQSKCKIKIKQADEKEKVERGFVYIAPAGYHLLIEQDRSFSLSCDAPVNFSRPSIDVLFETAAEVYEDKIIGVILTGANKDGAAGIQAIKRRGGITIAQNPASASFPVMPQAAIDTGSVEYIFELEEVRNFLLEIGKN